MCPEVKILKQIQSQGEPFIQSWTADKLSAEIRLNHCLRKFIGAELVAFICYRDNGQAYEVSLLATAPKWQGQGIMGQLLAELSGLAKARQREIWLETHENNLPAQKLYESLGFMTSGERSKYYPDGASAKLYLLR